MLRRMFSSIPLFMIVGVAMAVSFDDLSPAAREFIGGAQTIRIELKTGVVVHGALVNEDDDYLYIEMDKGSIRSKRRVEKSRIASYGAADLSKEFAVKLIEEFRIKEESSYTLEEYERMIPLLDEFIQKCPDATKFDELQAVQRQFTEDLERVKEGKEKVGGVWLTPVLAALRKFDLMTEQLDELEKRPDYRKNEKVQELQEKLIDDRRAVARDLPGMMRDRVPMLLQEKDFTVAAEEVHAFLQFWIAEVVASEDTGTRRRSLVADVVKDMDIDYIVRMGQSILDAYLAAGNGTAKRPKDLSVDKDMIYVPGGYFLMGDREAAALSGSFPMHLVYVSPFVIDKYEVSNVEYRKFVEYVKSSGDSSMEHPKTPPLKQHEAEGWDFPQLSRDKQPVVGVDWFDAYAYAKWVGKRLPTEAEWEKAAKGTGHRVYPWGDEIARSAVNWVEGRTFLAREMDRQNPPVAPEPERRFGCSCVKKADIPPPPPTKLPVETWDVDQWLAPEAIAAQELAFLDWDETYESAYGLMHMSGNAAEWVYDWYGVKSYAECDLVDPQGPEDGVGHVIRGGSFLTKNVAELSTTARSMRTQGPPKRVRGNRVTLPDAGFRCALSLEVVAK